MKVSIGKLALNTPFISQDTSLGMLQKTAKRAAKTATHLPGAIAKRFRSKRKKTREEDALWESKRAKTNTIGVDLKGSVTAAVGNVKAKGSKPMLEFVPVATPKKGETNRQRKQRLRELILGD
jgi:hypothetical protein